MFKYLNLTIKNKRGGKCNIQVFRLSLSPSDYLNQTIILKNEKNRFSDNHDCVFLNSMLYMSFTITIVLLTSTLLNDFLTSSMVLSTTDSSPTTSSSSSFLEIFKKRVYTLH